MSRKCYEADGSRLVRKQRNLNGGSQSIAESSKAVCLNSATACLEMTLRVMGIGEGDEVITTAYTYTATCSCICHTGATPGTCRYASGIVRDGSGTGGGGSDGTDKSDHLRGIFRGLPYSFYDRIFQITEEKKALFRPAN